MTDSVVHWASGARFRGSSDRAGDVTNPATGEVTARVAFADAADADAVIGAARAAARSWAEASITARTQVVFRFRELLSQRKDELAAIITSEHGKVLADAA